MMSSPPATSPLPTIPPPSDQPAWDVKTALSLILAGFAGILGFIGVNSTEVSAILRNNEVAGLIVFFVLLGAVAVALLSAVVRGFRSPEIVVVATLAFAVSAYAFVIHQLPIGGPNNQPSTASEDIAAWIAIGGAAVGAGALAIEVRRTARRRRAIHPTHPADGQNAAGKKPRTIDLHPFLMTVSILLLGMAVLIAIRLESTLQQQRNIQLDASLSGSNSSVSVVAQASRLRQDQYVIVVLCGIRDLSQNVRCGGNVFPDGSLSQISTSSDPSAAPCGESDSPGLHCRVIAAWELRPDISGAAKQTFSAPVNKSIYERVVGQAVLDGSTLVDAAEFDLEVDPASTGKG